MPRTQINCPNCKQPILADVEQLFDVAQDRSAKAKLLSGMANFVQCQVCGYQGGLATPIVYHDPEKELLLTFVPPEVGLPRDEQERLIGSLINKVVNQLPAEKRKAYLLTPKAHLTMQGLVERILEADGVTKEMIQAQQDKLDLLQKLSTTNDETSRLKLLKDKEELVDSDLFNMLNRLLETAAATGDQNSVEQLEVIQNLLVEHTEFGKQIRYQSQEVQAAIESLQAAGQELTREKLLNLMIEAPNDLRLSALVSLSRPGMDYEFYQILSQKIENADGEEKENLSVLREKLLELSDQIDAQIELRVSRARQLLEMILKEDDIEQAVQRNASQIDEYFLTAVRESLEAARKSGDLETSAKLNHIEELLRQMTSQPPEIEFLEELLEVEDDQARQELLVKNQEKISPEFFQMLSGLMSQLSDSDQDPQLVERVKTINRQVLRFSMQANLQRD